MLTEYNKKDAPAFRHFTPVQVRFNDIDIMGHVNNAIFQHYFDYARLGYFRQVFDKKLSWNGVSMILAGISIDFLKPVHLEEEIIIATRTSIIGNKSIRMIQEVHRYPEKSVVTRSESVLVAYDPAGCCSVPVPADWRDGILSFEEKVELRHPEDQR